MAPALILRHKPLPSYKELLKRAEEDGLDSLDTDDQRRMIRGWNRERIKARNAELAKK